jgi:uncharacterized protein (TIGR02145 family)
MRHFLLHFAAILVGQSFGFAQSPCIDLAPLEIQVVGDELSASPTQICQGQSISIEVAEGQQNWELIICNWGDQSSDTFASTGDLQLNHTYDFPGSYPIEVMAIDPWGCIMTNNDVMVLVSTSPEFNLDFPSSVCQGTPFEINADDVAFLEFSPEASIVSEELVILDDVGIYSSEIVVDQFSPGEVLESCSDFSLTANLEHSFVGDLTLQVECPNGTTVVLMDNGPSGGPDPTGCTPYDLSGNDLGIVNVEGFDYSWNMEAEWVLDDANNPNAASPMPSGVYLPCDDLCDFVGCPWNGVWTFTVLDQWGGDNGTLFGWQMNVDPDLLCLEQMSFQPQAGQNADSSFWYLLETGAPLSLDSSFVLALSSNGNSAELVLENLGAIELGYSVTNDFGCTWDTTLAIQVLDPPEFSLSTSEGVVGSCGMDNPVELEVHLMVGDTLTACSQSGSFSHCAGANDATTFSYCPDNPGDGTVMALDFLAGTLEYGWDYVTVFDGPDATGPVLATLSGDFGGQSFVATNAGGCISIQFFTDGGCDCAGFCDFAPIEWCVNCVGEYSICNFDWQWTPEEAFQSVQGGQAVLLPFEGDSLVVSAAASPTGIDECASVAEWVVVNSLDWDYDVIHPNCLGQDGSIELTVLSLMSTEVMLAELLKWEDGAWEVIATIDELELGSHVWSDLTSGDYSVHIVGTLCETETFLELISQPVPVVEVNAPTEVCPNSEVLVSAELNWESGAVTDSTWQIEWSNGHAGDSTFFYPEQNALWVAAWNNLGCISDTLQVEVDVFEVLEVNLESDTLYGCGGVSQWVEWSVEGGSGNFMMEWSSSEEAVEVSGSYAYIETADSNPFCLEVVDALCGFSNSDCVELMIEEIPAGQCDCEGTAVPDGFCNCQGDVEDAVGDCGGNCLLDLNSDEICDCALATVHLQDAEASGTPLCQNLTLSVDSLTQGSVLKEVFVNMEHSYLGDLEVILESPTGTSIALKNYGGGWIMLGLPEDDDVYNQGSTPGVGWPYSWANAATNGTMDEYIAANWPLTNQTLPAGQYASDTPFDVLGEDFQASGQWTLRICDTWTWDDGYLFSWGLVFEFGGEEFAFSEFCEPGCDDPLACNFQSSVTLNDGSCYYPNEDGDCICPEDADGDGICDEDDFCFGVVDECGICAGPGAIYDCGCVSIPDWACDCEWNVIDALGLCGGDCQADEDMDGICDDVDLCVGYFDDCGTCNGPILDGCCAGDADQDGICDDLDPCIGYEDELGVCGGNCQSDANGNGVCDDIEFGPCENVQSVTYQGHVYDVVALGNLCWFTENLRSPEFRNGDDIPLVAEGSSSWNSQYSPRKGIYQDNDSLLEAAGYLYNYSAVVDPRELCPQGWRVPLYSEFVEMWDSLGTNAIQYRATGLLEYGTGFWNSEVEGTNATGLAIQPFGSRTHIGEDVGWGSTTSLWSASTGLPQSGWGINFSSTSVGSNLVLRARGRYVRCVKGEVAFGCTDPEFPQYDSGAEVDDGSCQFLFGCTDPAACNYSELANTEDGTCQYLDECGICGGSGVAVGFCDCDGNQLDVLGVCGGDCEVDSNQNGVCDHEELVVTAEIDTTFSSGELNGYTSYLIYAELDSPTDAIGALYSQDPALPSSGPWQLTAPCGCWNPLDDSPTLSALHNSVLWNAIPEMELNEFDTFWTLGKSSIDQPGTSPNLVGEQPTYGPNICDQELSNSVLYIAPIDSALATAGEDLRILIARVTTCGPFHLSGNAQVYPLLDVTNFENKVFSLEYFGGCTNPLACNFAPEAIQDDGTCYLPQENGECVCPVDDDSDGICDDEDECVGQFDVCGVCNGPGPVEECGCSGIPTGACDCDGNELDAVGVCGGLCVQDADSDGVCDDVDDCVGFLDVCGVCNGLGAVYECGCSDIPSGNCNCSSIDSDGDGICDDDEGCVVVNGSCCELGVTHFNCALSAGQSCTDTLAVVGGDISGFEFILQFEGSGASWPGDLMMYLEDSFGNCVVWGGFDVPPVGTCQDLGTGQASFWPSNWINSASGLYTYDLPVSDIELESQGNWIVTIVNGWSISGTSTYSLDFAVLGVCGLSDSDCQTDLDDDGVCDIEDDCVGQFDDCGVCNGPGPVSECGCDDVPVDDCDCEGNQLDAIGVCGGSCESDVNNNGVCDLEELSNQGPENCGPGTLWDPEMGHCIVAVPSDADFDGCVDTMDLLELLTTFDSCPGDDLDQNQWSCGDPVSYQSYDYATVLIGDQCWFAENLRNENYDNGDAIPAGLSDSEWSSTTSGATAVYGESATNLEIYGRLYNWYAVDDARGLCPSGWHVPTDGEWMTMEMALGMSESEANSTGWRGTDQGTQMKTTYGWNGGGNGTNSSGFSGLPGGFRVNLGFFDLAGDLGSWWSSSPSGSGSHAWSRFLSNDYEGVYRSSFSRRGGFSVRCVRDAE